MTASSPATAGSKPVKLHGVAVALMACALLAIFLYVFATGLNYYLLPLADRPFHPLHRELRPAGRIGIGFGVFSTILLAAIYIYPLRKKWAWLRNIGSTRHWLDFHIVMGLAAPLLVALHSAFKFGGLAGMAYWILMEFEEPVNQFIDLIGYRTFAFTPTHIRLLTGYLTILFHRSRARRGASGGQQDRMIEALRAVRANDHMLAQLIAKQTMDLIPGGLRRMVTKEEANRGNRRYDRCAHEG